MRFFLSTLILETIPTTTSSFRVQEPLTKVITNGTPSPSAVVSNKRKLGATASVAIHDDWYDWDRTDYNLGFRWSINKHLLLSTSHRYSHFEQEDEDEDVLLNSARLLVNINPNMGLLNVVQHDSYMTR